MHSLVRRYIKTSIAFLGVGLALGIWMMIVRELGSGYIDRYVVSAHTHAVFVGFVMMMILGVALWLFPRPERDDTRYSPALAEAAYWTVTAGTAIRIAGELLRLRGDGIVLRSAVVASGLAQAIGLGLYFHTMWPRIRAAGSALRESRGERF